MHVCANARTVALAFGSQEVAVAVVWTERDNGRRVISMRRMHAWEIKHVGLD